MIGLLEPQICPKMLKKLSEKVGAKFPAITPSCSMVKIGHLDDLPETFFNPKQAPEKANHSSKKKTQGGKKKGKKNSKVIKPKAVGHFLLQNLDFCACPGQNVFKAILVPRTASCRVSNVFSTRLKLIWPRSSFKTTKMSKKPNFGKKFQVSMG